jgi:hypothetical protein
MDEEYTVISPWALWRRRLLIGAVIVFFLALVWGGEVLYDNWRVSSGPSAWFMVGTPVAGRRGPHAAPEYAFGDPYATADECNKDLNKLPRGGAIVSCRRLLLSDAAQMQMH